MRLLMKFLVASNVRMYHCADKRYLCTESEPKVTVGDAMLYWTHKFTTENISEPYNSVEHIIAHILNTRWITQLHQNEDKFLSQRQIEQLNTLCEQRLLKKPVQYIIKEWEFRDLTLKMRPPVFIPRPETEELVDIVDYSLDLKKTGRKLKLLEVGCGTGAIALSLKKIAPMLEVYAVDKSGSACRLAKHNADLNKLNITVMKALLTNDGFLRCPSNPELISGGYFDVIVSNPPYIPTKEIAALQPEIKIYESLAALDGGADGMDMIRCLLIFSSTMLPINGSLFLEVDHRHPEIIRNWTELNYPTCRLKLKEVFKDFMSKERFVHIVKEK